MDLNSKIYVAGHRGLVGSSIVRELESNGYKNILKKTREELDLLDQVAVSKFMNEEKPEYVFLAAARVGGIMANNNFPAEFIYENIRIQSNIMHSSYLSNVKKLLFLGSSCIYPKESAQPIKEDYFLTGPLEETNKAYAIAKISGIVMAQSYRKQYGSNFISVMPTNLYGPNDNFDVENSHVLPALIHKFHTAKQNNEKEVTLWGTGKPKREFLHVDDLAKACIFLMKNYENPEIINIGTGEDLSIMELAEKIKKVAGYDGNILWDSTKPDGTPRKLLDISKISSLGWKPNISLEEGIKSTYLWYTQRQS